MTDIDGDIASDPDRPIVYWDDTDNRYVFRASALGQPECRMIHAIRDAARSAPPEDLAKRWADGKRLESTVIDRLRDLGWDIIDGEAQTRLSMNIGSRARIDGHIDGVAVPKSNTVKTGAHVLEVKCLAPSSYEQAQRAGTASLPWGYAEQMAFYMLAMDRPGYWVAGRKNDDGEETGIDELHFEEVVEPPVSKAALVKKILGVIKRAEDPTYDPADDCPGEYGCPYWKLHPTEDTTEEAASGEEAARIDELAAEWEARDEQIKYETEKLKAVKDELMELLGNRGGVRGGKYRVTASTRITRTLPLKDVEAAGLLDPKLEKLVKVTESRFVNKPKEL